MGDRDLLDFDTIVALSRDLPDGHQTVIMVMAATTVPLRMRFYRRWRSELIDLMIPMPVRALTKRRDASCAAMGLNDGPAAPGDWRQDAACRGRRMYYRVLQAHAQPISRAEKAWELETVEVCHACPVIAECREWALTSPDPAFDHIAGGLTPRQRSDIRAGRPVSWSTYGS